MDYVKQNLGLKAAKLWRYVRLYGLRNTLNRARGQYHLRKRFATLPPSPDSPPAGSHVGLIGCGNYGFTVIAYYLRRQGKGLLRGCMDPDIQRAASLARAYGAGYYTDQARRIIEDPAIDLVYVASNHASHADYAIAALAAGKSVHIEKPHVVSLEQLARLHAALQAAPGRVNLGFNRTASRLGGIIKQALARQEGPAAMNWFVVGHHIDPDHWYYDDREGGRVLGNLCHWTDFTLFLVPPERRYPLHISAYKTVADETEVIITLTFGDRSVCTMLYTCKGETFEGVRERLSVQKGQALIFLDDFQRLSLEDHQRKKVYNLRHRDHGHGDNIRRGLAMVREVAGWDGGGLSPEHVLETGYLFLKVKEAVETSTEITIPCHPRELAPFAAPDPARRGD